MSSLVVIAPLPRFGSGTVTGAGRRALPGDQRVAGSGLPVDGQGDLADHGADQLLALAVGGRGGVEDGADVGAGAGEPGQFLAGQLDRVPGAGGGQGGFGAFHGGQAFLEPGFQGAGDQPVARLDLVVLAHRPAGFEPGPLQRQLERGHLVAVPLLGVGHRPGGGLQRRRLQHLEQLVQHGAVQVGAADALARRGAIQLGAAPAHIPGRVTAVPGVADLHHPAALAAADQPGQQRRALAGGAAAVPARRP